MNSDANRRAQRATIVATLRSVHPELDADAIADTILTALDATIPTPGTPPILAPHGRVLMELIVDPDASLQDVADRLGSTSSTIAHLMTRLVEAGWGVRTRVGRRNHYEFDRTRLLEHRDITMLCRALGVLATPRPAPEGDSTPGYMAADW